MAFIGLRYPVFAPIASEPELAAPTYSKGVVLGKAVSADVKLEFNDESLYADDALAESETSFKSGTIEMGLDDISSENEAVVFGVTAEDATEEGGQKTVTYSASDTPPFGGLGFFKTRQKDGKKSYRAYWYLKTKFKLGDDSASTNGDKIEWQTPTVSGTIYKANNDVWREYTDFDTVEDAIAYLNKKAMITSGGA